MAVFAQWAKIFPINSEWLDEHIVFLEHVNKTSSFSMFNLSLLLINHIFMPFHVSHTLNGNVNVFRHKRNLSSIVINNQLMAQRKDLIKLA